MRGLRAVGLLLLGAVCSCSTPAATASGPASSPRAGSVTTPPADVGPASAAPRTPEPETTARLLAVAQLFNDEYGRNDDGPVYDRWDARSQAIISRSDYIRRHRDCPTAPQAPARVETATPGAGGAWLVRYEIGGQQLTDYWYYVGGRWVFDLVQSNPHAAQLYRLSPAAYASAVACAGK